MESEEFAVGSVLQEVVINGGKMDDHTRTMQNPVFKNMHKGQDDFLNHPITQGVSIVMSGFIGVEAILLERSYQAVKAGSKVVRILGKAGGKAAKTVTPITKNSIIKGFKVSNHAWRKSGLGRGATEELVGNVITGAKKAGTVLTETGTGKFSGNVIKVYNHNGIKVAVDETRKLIMSIRPESGFKLP